SCNMSTMEGIRLALPMLSPAHFVFPLLAHSFGTLVGAFVTDRLVAAVPASNWPLVVGSLFFLGGVSMVKMVGGPLWFIALDLLLAYFPMALLGSKLAGLGVETKPKNETLMRY
ncbi:MAG: hypothetical protein A3D92_11985, partial [Bacteroidetes bacterium RIFCSPHIGHO2_02_FULL_44_7]